LAHFLQLAPRLGRLPAEVFELGLLLGREDGARPGRARALQRGELLLRLVEAVLERLDLAEIGLLRARLHVTDHRERARRAGTAAQPHERRVARELVDERLREGEVAVALDDD